ncbi:MAG: nickel-dependent hydrogenase large subunit, partial [Rhodospirillaceae bacterium]
MSSTLSQPATTSRLIAGPFNRVEGDLEITLDIEEGRVSAAYANSPLFRGFEQILLGKDPRDALTITPRICGICSISQSAAAARALADASGLVSTEAGQTAAALIHAVENLADHLTHFYLFFMPDFAKPIYADRPWHGQALDRVAGSAGGQGSSRALQARAELLHIMGLLAGKWPHTLALQPGGVTKTPNTSDLVRLHSILRGFRRFLETEMIGGPLEAFAALETHKALEHWHHNEPGGGDLRLFLTIAEDLALHKAGMGPDRFLSFGAYPRSDGPLFAQGLWRTGSLHEVPFDAIEEHIGYSWMTGTGPLHPFAGETHPDPAMADPAYSWCKAPRLVGRSVEVGAIARQIVDGHPLALDLARNGASVHSR